jgi:hypothetical protein
MKTIELLDNFAISDNSGEKGLAECYRRLSDIDASTIAMPISTDDLVVWSIDHEGEHPKTGEFGVLCRAHTPGQAAMRKTPEWFFLSKAKLVGNIGEEGYKELLDTQYLLAHDNKKYYASATVVADLAARAGLQGPGVYDPQPELFSLIMRRYGMAIEEKKAITMIMRRSEENTARKIIAVRSEKYAYIPQMVLKNIIEGFSDDMGKPTCKEWEITQTLTTIRLDFPKVANDIADVYELKHDITPGVVLCTSDTGESSLTAVGTFSVRNATVYSEIYKKKHSGAVDVDAILKEIEDSIFNRYNIFPQKLTELLDIDIVDPAIVIEDILRQIDFVSIGKRIASKFEEALIAELNPTVNYTAYDLCMAILELPNRYLGDATSLKGKLGSIVYKAAFADYRKADEKAVVALAS